MILSLEAGLLGRMRLFYDAWAQLSVAGFKLLDVRFQDEVSMLFVPEQDWGDLIETMAETFVFAIP